MPRQAVEVGIACRYNAEIGQLLLFDCELGRRCLHRRCALVQLLLAGAVGQAQQLFVGGLQGGLSGVAIGHGGIQVRRCREFLLQHFFGSLVACLCLHHGCARSCDPGTRGGDILCARTIAQLFESGVGLREFCFGIGDPGQLASVIQLHQQRAGSHHRAFGDGFLYQDFASGGLEHNAVAFQCTQRFARAVIVACCQ